MPNFPFVPQEKSFFELFRRSAENMVKTAILLQRMLNDRDITQGAAAITEMEHQGDSITHEIIALLHRTFVTPFDREDIATLAHTLDDVTDLIHAAADDMVIYKVSNFTERSKELAETIVQAATTIERAMPLLEKRSEIKNVLRHCVEINRYENEADLIYRSAMGELFERPMEVTDIIKWREIYDHLEMATDRCEDVANILEGIAIKHG
jgi:predicted phosphate transport protein (TIGR00153 family)